MSRYFLYHRVSKKVQSTDGQGIDRQKEITQQWIDNHNKSIVENGGETYSFGKVYEDRGRSGYTQANIEKGELGKLLKDIENGFITEGDIIVIELIDRFSRAEPDVVRDYFDKILRSKIKVAITKWNIVFEDGMKGVAGVSARVLLELGLFLSHQESAVKSERIIATNKILANKGIKTTAKTPIWLRRTPDRCGYEVVSQNAEIIRKIFELKHRGLGAKRIINEIGSVVLVREKYDEHGIVVASSENRPLSESSINIYLRSESVIGLRDGEIYYPPIVDESLFYSCQHKFKQKAKGRVSAIRNILSGIVYCAECGYKMAYKQSVSKRGKVRAYLKCNNKRSIGRCNAKNIKYFPVEACVYGLLKHIGHDEEREIDVSAIEYRLEESYSVREKAMDFMLKYEDNKAWMNKYEEAEAKIKTLEIELADAKRERTGDFSSLDLNLEKLEDKAKLNQILKEHDVKVALKHDQDKGQDILEMLIGSWDDYHIIAHVNERTALRGKKTRWFKERGNQGLYI
ncbi:recombinase family protein [Vibrio sp. Vb0718]|uniref:recombinase family protein n=1 Tax=Vibrio sp. Vb0718 TaxID=3074630 RepID=UPI0029646918|nr:recombinase family protein [Vibrio sp. Vb0718]MDW1835738.1 recombinase family protein [Vibrio sp. Vb0718]